ncbi:efflux transporter outer membrane subunit [Novosphingobium sp. G106]|uniref:efflux transporter outer membrane subunit n=1 Tax=Novosphingobium sp. G106 TaxID=2849500 RepID=UPI001C2DEA1E|nr:efflux transporter outer membrane subunit [Novosphingobium sp. G106]MBV1687582.1 efflux transporter outer membrane subunit [Novosphingobium sp. G106]
MALGACTVGPNFTAPAAPPPQANYAGDGSGRAALGEGPDRGWWTAFGSRDLDALVDRAIANNHSLAASKATLERARERINAARGRTLPQVDANARAEYQQLNLAAFGFDAFASSDGQSIKNPKFDLYTIGGGVTYDLDLFGRNRRAVEQTVAEAEAVQRQTEAAHLVIAGRVVEQVMMIAALNDLITTQHTLLDEDQRNVTLTRKRQEGGVGTLVEVLSAEGQLAEDRGGLPAVEQQLVEARGMLAVLLGISPGELETTSFTMASFTLPGQVPVALPSALVHKRPDILEAEARLHAATAAVGVATAQLYPDITLGANLSQSTSVPGSMFSSQYRGFDIFAGLTAPIFHGGTLKAQQRGAEADARAAAETYKQTVTEAFGQVSNLLSALDTDGRALATRQESAQIAQRSLGLSRRSFQVGNSGVLQVLEANRLYQRAELALVQARSRQYLNVARLYVATAGGWVQDVAQAPGATPQS